MSNKLMITWGILITFIVSAIFIIGVYYEKNYDYIKADNEVKEIIKKYLKEEEIKLYNLETLEIESNFLKEKGYFEKITLKESSCTFTANIKRYYIFNSYKIKYNCLNEILE